MSDGALLADGYNIKRVNMAEFKVKANKPSWNHELYPQSDIYIAQIPMELQAILAEIWCTDLPSNIIVYLSLNLNSQVWEKQSIRP